LRDRKKRKAVYKISWRKITSETIVDEYFAGNVVL